MSRKKPQVVGVTEGQKNQVAVPNSGNVTANSDSFIYPEYGYVSGYHFASTVTEQIAILRQYDWGRNVDWTLNIIQKLILQKPLPFGSEGYFAVVFDHTMVIYHEDDPSVDQSGPVTFALNALSKQRDDKLINFLEGHLQPQYYHRNKKSTEKLRQLWESQGCPTGILLIPAQLGIGHAQKSLLSAREAMQGTEFPLDANEAIQMVLTQKKRLQHYHDLWINFPGSEYSPDADDVFQHGLSLSFYAGALWFEYQDADDKDCIFGAVSGFLPQGIDSGTSSVGCFCIFSLGILGIIGVRFGVLLFLFFGCKYQNYRNTVIHQVI